MIAVDTSVWISALRSREKPEAAILSALLDAGEVMLPVLVRLELVLGASGRDRARLRRVLSALPVAYPSDSTWVLMDTWAEKAADAGQRFGAGDLLIAALASEHGALVWSLDGDFGRMERCDSYRCMQPSSVPLTVPDSRQGERPRPARRPPRRR